jgi:UDP-glucose 4-epimerase
MKILVTGSTGRVGRAIYVRLCAEHAVVGIDVAPSSTADIVAPIQDAGAAAAALRGVDAVVHVAALHAPHVGHRSDADFDAINVEATRQLARLAIDAGVKRFLLTSTTALYGAGAPQGAPAAWVTEDTPPRPRTIYHRTKLAAERALETHAGSLAITCLRMSRCFPEPAPLMAAYRLHRGVDARDVAEAHALALDWKGPGFRKLVISGATPFLPADAAALGSEAAAVIAHRAPRIAAAFAARGWRLPARIDRVYDSTRAVAELGWRPRHGFEEVLAELDRGSPEVLPCRSEAPVPC